MVKIKLIVRQYFKHIYANFIQFVLPNFFGFLTLCAWIRKKMKRRSFFLLLFVTRLSIVFRVFNERFASSYINNKTGLDQF